MVLVIHVNLVILVNIAKNLIEVKLVIFIKCVILLNSGGISEFDESDHFGKSGDSRLYGDSGDSDEFGDYC